MQFFVETSTKQKKQLSELNSKYANLKAKTKNCDNTTDKQLIKIIYDLKAKLSSSQESYESLLIKMETLCKHNDELTRNVAKLEAIKQIPTETPKKKFSNFEMAKKDASTPCDDLFKLDTPHCEQVFFRNVICRNMYTRDRNGECTTYGRSGLPHQGLDSSERQDEASSTSLR